ncbi:hypothetical protein MMC30_009022 [Trapelia coarctata]|nr:hypothetical protein [Trapelia coarctata]
MVSGYATPHMLLAAWILLLSLPLRFAQTTDPSNGSLPVDPNNSQLLMNSRYDVDPLTDQAGLSATPQSLQQIRIVGNLIATSPLTVAYLQVGQLAYISCDPWVYQGFKNAQTTISDAIQKIQGPSFTQGAIVLYSRSATFCTYASGTVNYPWVYTMTNATESRDLGDSLNSTGLPSVITLDPVSLVNNSSPTPANNPQDALGPSPTTAVAMIILYSITGIITTLFLIIIITGAVRAHRHPERYGPRNVIGRPRQTRARGIARAMLESLPIVKFGEPEIEAPKAVPNERDIELGQTERSDPRTTTSSEAERAPTAPGEQRADGGNADGDIVTEAAEGIAQSLDRAEGGGENDAESGLACSVCTDDFIKGQDIRVLPCNHKFHPECIDPWLLNVSGTCPMCRVDLRPVADHAEDLTDGTDSSQMPDRITQNFLDLTGYTVPEWRTMNRRRSTGLSSYIHHTLNFRRMRDATPEERIDALRQVQLVNRASNEDPERGERTRTRVGSRLSRLWGSQQAGSSEEVAPEPEVAGEHSQTTHALPGSSTGDGTGGR